MLSNGDSRVELVERDVAGNVRKVDIVSEEKHENVRTTQGELIGTYFRVSSFQVTKEWNK